MRFVLFLFVLTLFATPCMAGLDEGDESAAKVFTPRWVQIPNDPNTFVALTEEVDLETEPGVKLYVILLKDEAGDVYRETACETGVDSKECYSVRAKGKLTTVNIKQTESGPVIAFTIIDE